MQWMYAEELLKKEKVAVVPGTAFGDSGEGFLRISYAYSLDAWENIKSAEWFKAVQSHLPECMYKETSALIVGFTNHG